MKKIILLRISVLCMLLLAACSKSHQDNPTDSSIKIEILSGNNQTDSIGVTLKDSVTIKVSKAGKPLPNYFLQFHILGCDDDLLSERQLNSAGIGVFSWRLTGVIGKQSLKVVLLDNNRKKIDSITAIANTIKNSRGYVRSACTPNANPLLLSKISTGRLLALFADVPFIYYSDDNAVTWHKLVSSVSFKSPYRLVSSPANELFLLDNSSLYYSGDMGKTWTIRNPLNAASGITAITYAPSGKLITVTANTDDKQIQISTDKGLNWTPIGSGYPHHNYIQVNEDKSGDLVFLGDAGYIVVNHGALWHELNPTLTYRMTGMTTDDKGNLYIGRLGSTYNTDLLKSGDSGTTYNVINSGPYLDASMTQQSDGNIYIWQITNGIMKLSASNTLVRVTPPGLQASGVYVLAGNGSLVFGDNSAIAPKSTLVYTLP